VVVGADEEVVVEDDVVEAATELVVVVLALLAEVLELVVENRVELDVLELDVEHTGPGAVYGAE
jgi:hypothetical protein